MKVGDRVKISWVHLFNEVGVILSTRNYNSFEVGFAFNIVPRDINYSYSYQRESILYNFVGKPEHSMFFHSSYLRVINTVQLSGVVTSVLTSKIFKLDTDKMCILDCVYDIKVGAYLTVDCIPANKSYTVVAVRN